MAKGMAKIDKAELLEVLRKDVADALEVMVQAARTAKEAATHEEMKPENDKDTRGLEAGYLAGAQAARAQELSRTLAGLSSLEARAFADGEPITALALVALEDTDTEARSWVFVSPYGGGRKLQLHGIEIQIATAQSPLGDALIGKRTGDLVEVTTGGRTRELEILSVA